MTDPQYLAIKNWSKYQPKLKDGKRSRTWTRTDCNRLDDPDFEGLTLLQRAVYDGIRDYSGRSGRWMINDASSVSRAIHAIATDRSHVGHAVVTLLSRGFLVLCNQQYIDDFLPNSSNVTRRNVTKKTPLYISPEKPQPIEAKKEARFEKPTVKEVSEEMQKQGIPSASFTAEAFVAFYESNGWKVGKNPMRSWRGALTTWKHRASAGGNGNGAYHSESAPKPQKPMGPGVKFGGVEMGGMRWDDPAQYYRWQDEQKAK